MNLAWAGVWVDVVIATTRFSILTGSMTDPSLRFFSTDFASTEN